MQPRLVDTLQYIGGGSGFVVFYKIIPNTSASCEFDKYFRVDTHFRKLRGTHRPLGFTASSCVIR